MQNKVREEITEFSKVVKALSTENILQYLNVLNRELNQRNTKQTLVAYKHDCHGSSNYHLNKYKHWCKLVTSVDRSKTDGYAFIGDFLKYRTENMIPEGSIVVEVCNTNYYAYRVTDDHFKEQIAHGKRSSLHQFIVAVDEALKDSQSIIIDKGEEALSTIQPE